ncbi:hypothetical protein SmJEL517_g04073 [Synchytrium microbalum]|uniref:Glyoxalase-like domain-containing protein n=1 Tax=Synchytrium microbalum TaxID=1806994 RepID=A0A507C0I4_9FUNG|nr:uncharacterized protein SmJEL517_g04073 [Synchytrium microbalum]TPX32878.1 hypothetical protein SmJEL517_g04073 [Synchytrium microbalum]
MSSPIFLRQIALVAYDLPKSNDIITKGLNLEQVFHDPEVEEFGLHNTLWVLGGGVFLEVVAPLPGRDINKVSGGRFLKARKGDGGYMIILQMKDATPTIKRMKEDMGIRVVWGTGGEGHGSAGDAGAHFHPKDTRGGNILSISHHAKYGGDPVASPLADWPAGGPRDIWIPASKRADKIRLVGCSIQSDNPKELAAHWSQMLNLPVSLDKGIPCIDFSNARLKFVEGTDGRGEGICELDVAVEDVSAATKRAIGAGGRLQGDRVEMVGMWFHFVPLTASVGVQAKL